MLYPRNRIKYVTPLGALSLYSLGFFVAQKGLEFDQNILIVFFAALFLIALGQGEDVRTRRAVTGLIISSFYFPLFLLVSSIFFKISPTLREYYYIICWVFAFGFFASLFNSGAALTTFAQAFCFYFYKKNQTNFLKMLLRFDPVLLDGLNNMKVKEISDFCLVVGTIWVIFFGLFYLFGYMTGAKNPVAQ